MMRELSTNSERLPFVYHKHFNIDEFITGLELRVWTSFGWYKGFIDNDGHTKVLQNYKTPDGFPLVGWL